MASSLAELLAPQVLIGVFSRLKDGRGPLASWLGFQPDRFDAKTVEVSGPQTMRGEGAVRNYTYRYFDHTRVVMKARAPGTGPATVAQNPMGQNTVSVARWHQKMPLNYEFLGQLSPMIGPNSQIDPGGQAYIMQQTQFLAEQANNAVEVMAAGMMRDSLYFINSGDNWLPTFTAPTGTTIGFQVPFLVPAGNKNQLNMLGTGNIIQVAWNNATAPIIGNIQQIIAAYKQLSRYNMTDTWSNSIMWYNVLTNTEVRNTAGSSNTPFAEFELGPEPGMNETGPPNLYSAILKGQPTVKWHFCDDTVCFNSDVDVTYSTAPSNASLVKLVPDNMCIFCTAPESSWARFYLGGEHVIENPGQPGALRMGWYFWHEYVTQPAAVELISLLNGVPLLIVPLAIAPAQVIF